MFGSGRDQHPRPRKGAQLGRDAEMALRLIAEQGGREVRLQQIPARERHYVNSKAVVLEEMALLEWDGDPRPSHRTYTLTELGRSMAELLPSR